MFWAYLNVLSSKFHKITVGEATDFAFLNPSEKQKKIKLIHKQIEIYVFPSSHVWISHTMYKISQKKMEKKNHALVLKLHYMFYVKCKVMYLQWARKLKNPGKKTREIK